MDIRAIKAIEKDIERRETALRHRRMWYLDPVAFGRYNRGHTFTWYGFYITGYKIMKELAQLREIKKQLLSIC